MSSELRYRFPSGFAVFVLGLLTLSAYWSAAANAQTYPIRPVRIVVPAAAGGALDIIARVVAHKMSEIWGQQIYIENRPGANFVLGMDAVAKSAPDGYTLLFTSSAGVTLNPHVFHDMSLDPLRDLKPVIMVSSSPFALLVNPSVPAENVAEFVDHLKANAGKLNHGSNSASTMMVSELFKELAKVEYVDINYRGASQALVSTHAGTTQFSFVDMGSAASPIESKTLRVLALSSSTRDKLNPDIPTFAESGLPLNVSAITLLLIPSATPREIVNMVHRVAERALASPDVVKKLLTMGNAVQGAGPEAASLILTAESEQWQKLVKSRNIKLR